jgi:enamine deaminase RidA (YjgF/YER057c/UK114 family)
MESVRTEIIAKDIAPPAYQYTHGLRVTGADLLILSGQLAVGTDGALVGVGDFAAQAHQVFHNIEVLLNAAGASLADVVRFTVYLVRPDDGPKFWEVREQVFARTFGLDQPFPTSTMIFVKGLVTPEFLIEIEATAAVARQ